MSISLHLKKSSTYQFVRFDLDAMIAASVLFAASLLCALNVYTLHSAPIWDGSIYNKLISSFISNGYSIGSIDISELSKNQLGASYANRIFYFILVGTVHKLTGADLIYIYPALNLFFAFLTAYYIYKICNRAFKIGFSTSVGAGLFFLINPNILLIYQALAHPELLMTALVAIGYYHYKTNSFKVATAFIFLAILSKQVALLASIFIMLEILLSSSDIKQKAIKIATLALFALFAIKLPTIFINNTEFKFSWDVITLSILKNLNGHLFQDILFNFGVLWILFFAGLPLLPKIFTFKVVILILLGLPISLIGSTDWFRTWFSILFFIVIPVSAKALDYVTSHAGIVQLRALSVFCYVLLLIKPSPFLNMDYVHKPEMINYTLAASLFVFLYLTKVLSEIKITTCNGNPPLFKGISK